jgi:hypothetical protein
VHEDEGWSLRLMRSNVHVLESMAADLDESSVTVRDRPEWRNVAHVNAMRVST